MASPRAILYVDTCPENQSAFFEAFAAAGYVVVTAQSAQQAIVLSFRPNVEAVIMWGTRCQSETVLAEKLKFLNPEMPIVLICPESQATEPLPPWIDAGTCSDTPKAAVLAIAAFLSTRRCTEIPAAA